MQMALQTCSLQGSSETATTEPSAASKRARAATSRRRSCPSEPRLRQRGCSLWTRQRRAGSSAGGVALEARAGMRWERTSASWVSVSTRSSDSTLRTSESAAAASSRPGCSSRREAKTLSCLAVPREELAGEEGTEQVEGRPARRALEAAVGKREHPQLAERSKAAAQLRVPPQLLEHRAEPPRVDVARVAPAAGQLRKQLHCERRVEAAHAEVPRELGRQ